MLASALRIRGVAPLSELMIIQPTAIIAAGKGDGKFLYRVRFRNDHEKKVPHVFTLTSEDGIDGVSYTHDFWLVAGADPFANELCQSKLSFQQARRM
jgi:hypothetical protein